MITKENERLRKLATSPVGRLLWEYSLPAVVGMLVMSLYNVVDRIFIGQVVGPEAIAGLAITFPLMNITTAIGVLVGVGSCTRISIALGRKNHSLAERYLGNAATLTIVNGIVYIAAFMIFIDPILYAFGAREMTLPYARTYMLWVLPGLLLTNIAFGLNNVLRATGYPQKAMMTMLIGAITNVILDAVFVLMLDWGMVGAAIATDIAMLVSAIFVVSHFFDKKVNLRFRRGTFRLKGRLVWSIVSIGSPQAIINVASCLINIVVNHSLLKHGGDIAIGAAGIFITFVSILTTIVLGITMGLQPIIGYNYGAGNMHRVKRATWIAIGVSTCVTIFGGVLGCTIPDLIARAFTSDKHLIDITEVCLRNALWAFPVVGFQIIATNFFQSIGATGYSMFMSLSRQVIFLIPLLLWLPNVMEIVGVWISFPIADLCATVCAVVLFDLKMRQINKMIAAKA